MVAIAALTPLAWHLALEPALDFTNKLLESLFLWLVVVACVIGAIWWVAYGLASLVSLLNY